MRSKLSNDLVVQVIKVGVSLGILYILLAQMDWVQVWITIQEADLFYIFLAFFAFLFIALIETVRLQVIFYDYQMKYMQFLRLHVVGSAFGSVMPGQLGGDIYKIYAMNKQGQGIISPILLMLLLRLIGMSVLLVAAVLAIYLHWTMLAIWIKSGFLYFNNINIYITIIASLLILSLVIPTCAFRFAKLKLLVKSLIEKSKLMSQQVGAKISFYSTALILVFSVIMLILRVLMFLFLVYSVGLEVRFYDMLLVATLATLSTVLPISFAGLGVREGLVVVLLLQFGISYESAIVVAFVSRIFMLLISLAGIVWLYSNWFVKSKLQNQQ